MRLPASVRTSGLVGASDELLEVWRSDLHRSRSRIGHPNHAFVSYERLVAHPHSVLRRLCEFLELPLDDAVLDRMVSDYAVKGTQIAAMSG